ncbi:MAG: hypothetical protein QF526_02850, partial [Alphaproteobacteria bacterium]|nr:hypothetical protein [Alphaproteobacteria bacterium]
KSRGYKPGRFSFNVRGGRCEACEGDGVITYEMHFLPDVYIQCDECKKKMKNCCSNKCLEITRMPYLLQKELRKGQKNSNDIFKKGRTNNITTFNKNEL